jgi:glycosyltransferase involved in cell wall biosynthesis
MAAYMSVTCIIPAYNEARRIENVLKSVIEHPQIRQIIVVDDGSQDETSAIVAAIDGVTLITLPENRGKTAALAQAMLQATGVYLLLIDADLAGLGAKDVTALLNPVLLNWADVAISLRRNAPYLWHWIGLDYISGERVLPRALIVPHLDRLTHLPKFGFEVFLNSLIVDAQLRVAVVHWPDVVSPLKAQKYGLWTGLRGDISMLRDLLQSVSLLGLLQQIIALRGLRADKISK